MIKCVIFDLGGVLIKNIRSKILNDLADRHNISQSEMKKYAKPIFYFLVIGNMSDLDYLRMILKHFKIDENAETIVKDMNDNLEKNEEVWKIVEKVKIRYKTGIISDMGITGAQVREEQFHLSNWFDYIVYSYQERCRKPDEKIFKTFLKRAGMQAEECIFIDDHEKNVDAAKKMGMKAILFKDAIDLETKLKVFGVLT